VYLDNEPLKKQLRYADLRGIPLVVLMPRLVDEAAAGQILLKDMQTGQQELVSRIGLANYIAGLLRQKPGDK
jgi:histidyl-tRNA synthetase